MKHWKWFAVNVLKLTGNVLPPTLDGLLQWSRVFRHHKTFGNYCSYVKLACDLQGVPTEVFSRAALRRAKDAIKKRRLWLPRQPTWIKGDLVQMMLVQVLAKPELKDLVMLFLASYVFLLRLPSEGLPLAVRAAPGGKEVPVFSGTEAEVRVWFPFRKNRFYPTEQTRKCWCSCCPATCPTHVLGPYMTSFESGTQPFAHIPKGQALVALRELLLELGVADALVYRTHDLRRGHAEELRLKGGRLCDILSAGDWASKAFMSYLDRARWVATCM